MERGSVCFTGAGMTDNELLQLLITTLNTELVNDGFTGVTVIQAYQPTQQGILRTPTVYLSKQSDYWYAWKELTTTYDPVNGVNIVTENQDCETTFRLKASVIQDPANLTYTASDLINEVGCIFRSQPTIEAFALLRVGIIRFIDASNTYSKEDREQFEAFPAFNFTLSHERIRITKIPVIQSTESIFARV